MKEKSDANGRARDSRKPEALCKLRRSGFIVSFYGSWVPFITSSFNSTRQIFFLSNVLCKLLRLFNKNLTERFR
jgi:hypothetical protein